MANKHDTDADDTETFIKIASGETNASSLIQEFEISNPVKKDTICFSGLSKEEVLKYANDPQWVKIRWFIFALFWIIWLAMLVAAILLIVFSPKCPYKPRLEWYEKEVIYQIDVARFKDFNGDGVGDLNGIKEKIDYINDLGVKTISLHNFVDDKEPLKINSIYGNFDDLKEFKKELKLRFMHLIIDIPIQSLGLNEIDLKSSLTNAVSFWLNNYADGVRITNMELIEHKLQFKKIESVDSLFASLRKIVDEISEKTLNTKLILFSSNNYDLNYKFKEYNPSFVINQLFSEDDFSSNLETPENITKSLNKNNENMANLTPNNMLSWPSNARLGNLEDKNLVDLAQTLLMLLHGTPIVLYGDELGLESRLVDSKLVQSYMQWDNKDNCGFTKNSSIIIEKNKCKSSVSLNKAHGAGDTKYDLFTNLTRLRSKEAFQFGKNIFLNDTNVFAFLREAEGFPVYLIITHFNKNDQTDHLLHLHTDHNIAENAVVEYFYSTNNKINYDFQVGKEINTNRILLKFGEILVLELK